MSTPSTFALLDATMPTLVGLEASAGVSGQPSDLKALGPGASLTARERHVYARVGTLESLAGVTGPAFDTLPVGDSEEARYAKFLTRLQRLVDLGSGTQPAGFTLTKPSYVSTMLETADGQPVRQLAEGKLLPAGFYPYQHDGKDVDGNALGAATGYRMRAYSHTQSGEVAAVFSHSIGNSGRLLAGNRALRGFNNPDAELCVVLPADVRLQVPTITSTPENPQSEELFMPAGTAVLFKVFGYTEGGIGVAFSLLSDPQVDYALHESGFFSGTHLAKSGNTILIAGVFVLDVYDYETGGNYAGPGIIGIDLLTFADKVFPAGVSHRMQSNTRQYSVLATKLRSAGGTEPSLLTAANNKIFLGFRAENRVQVLEATNYTTLQNLTIAYPFGGAATGNVLWLAHGDSDVELAERFTVNDDGTLSSTGQTLNGVSKIGFLAYSWDQTKLLLTDVAEPCTLFPDQGGTLVHRRIYYLNEKMYRYTGETGQSFTRAQWDALPANGNGLFTPTRFLTSTNTHRVREFDAVTGAAGAVHGSGDYVTNPMVANDKWLFCGEGGHDGNSDNIYITSTPSGGYVLRDKANARVIIVDSGFNFIAARYSTGATYDIAGNLTTPTEHWIRLRRYQQRFNVDNPGQEGVGWWLDANFTASGSVAGWASNWNKMLSTVGGRTLGFRRNAQTYTFGVWEVTTTGLVDWNLATKKDLGSALQEDFSWLEIDNYDDGGARRVTKRPFAGYEQSGRPLMADEVVLTTLPDVADRRDPRLTVAPSRITPRGDIWVYDTGVASQDSDRMGLGCYHLGSVRAGQSGWQGRTMPASSKLQDMENPLGNVFYVGSNVQNAGSFHCSADELEVTWKKDEFGWNGNNNHGKFYWKGAFVFEYGLPRYGGYAARQGEAGSGGNADSGYMHLVGDTFYVFQGSEGGNGVPGVNVTAYKDFKTSLIEHAPAVLTQWTPKAVRAGYSLMDNSRWASEIGQYTRLQTVDNLDILPRDGVSKRIQFDNTDNSQVGTGLLTCALNPLSADLPGWVLDGKAFLRQADNQYQHSYRQVVDDQGRVIVKARRVDNLDGTHSYEVNGVVVATEPGPAQTRALFWLHDWSVRVTSAGLRYQDSTYPARDIAPFDPQANIHRPAALQFLYQNNQNGGYSAGVANLWFEPLS